MSEKSPSPNASSPQQNHAKSSGGGKVRLNKLIADSGLASRRAADRMIEEGLVTVNGKKVYELGVKVNPHIDKVMVEGKPLRSKSEFVYLMLHNPKGVLTTMEDPLERPTIKDFLLEVPMRVFPIGRLDWDSEGLLLLTNDGDYANKVASPDGEVTKTYLVKVDGHPREDQLNKLKMGVPIEGGRVAAKSIEKIRRGQDQYDWIKIVITEGKNRQIRQMFAKIGYDVLKLQRVAIGRLRIGNLERGELVFLNDAAKQRVFLPDLPDEVKKMKSYKGRNSSAASEGKKEAPKEHGTKASAKSSGSASFAKSRAKSSGHPGSGAGKRPSRPSRPGGRSAHKASSRRP